MGITWKPVIAAHRFKELADGMGMMRPKKTCHKAMKATAMVSEVDFDMGDAGDDLPAPESEHLTTGVDPGDGDDGTAAEFHLSTSSFLVSAAVPARPLRLCRFLLRPDVFFATLARAAAGRRIVLYSYIKCNVLTDV